MSDGTYQAVVYSQPVHELVDGVWVEIQATNPNARGDVTTDSTKSNIIDNYVLKGYGVQNKSLDRLYIGNRSAGLTRAYILQSELLVKIELKHHAWLHQAWCCVFS